MPDLVGTFGKRCLCSFNNFSDHRKSEPGRACLYKRGAVSML